MSCLATIAVTVLVPEVLSSILIRLLVAMFPAAVLLILGPINKDSFHCLCTPVPSQKLEVEVMATNQVSVG